MATPAHFGKYPHHNGGTQRCDIWEDEGDVTTFRSILHFWISPAVQIKKGPTKKDNAESLVKFFSDVATPRQPKPQTDFFSTSEIKRKETRTKENGNKERGPKTLDGTDNFKFKLPAFASDLEEAKNTRLRRGRTFRTVAVADDTSSPLRLNESSVPGGRVLPVVVHSNPTRAAVSASTTATFQCWQGWDTFKGNSGQVSCDKKSSVRDWQLGGVSSLQTQTGTDTPKPRTVVVVEDPAEDTHFRTVTDSRNSTGARNWKNSSDKGKRHESESINRGDADRDFDHRTVSPVSCRVLSGVTGPAAVTALLTVTTPDAVAASLYTDTYFPAGSNNSFDAQPKLTGISSRSVQLQQFHSQPEGSNFLSRSNTHSSKVHRDSAYALSIDTDQYSSLNGGTSTSVAVSPNGTVHVGCVRVVIEPIEKKADFKQPPCGILPVVRQRRFSFEADTKLGQNSDSERQSQSCASLHANSPGKDSLASVSRFKSVLVKEQRKVVDLGLVSLEHNSDSALTATCLKDCRLPHARDNAQVSVKGGHFLSSSGRVRAESSPAPCQPNSSLQDSVHTNHSSVVKGVKEDLFHSQCVQIELASFTGVRHHSSRSNGALKGVRHQPVYSESAHIEPSSFKGERYQPVHSSSMIPMEVSETVAIVKLPNYAEHSFESAVHYSDMRRHKSTVNFEPVLAPVRFADTMYLWGKDTTKKRYVSRTFYEPRVKPKRFGETDFIFPKGKTERFASFVDFHIDECRKWFKTCVELKARTFTTVHSFPESSTVTSSSVTSPGLRRDVTVNGGDGGGLHDGPGASQVFIPPHKVGSKGLGEKHFRVALDKEKVDVNMNGPISNGL
ncbi:hypothetical protein V1264_017758 [Littorina saxatilis]|uniref:Uncharacterized protein n=1 Tax=Littorina saxatilis TaxID=31220 RepID=A0AAN9BI09_9CAEN